MASPRACFITLCQLIMQITDLFFFLCKCILTTTRYMSDHAAFFHLNLCNLSVAVKGSVQPKLCCLYNDKTTFFFVMEKNPKMFAGCSNGECLSIHEVHM